MQKSTFEKNAQYRSKTWVSKFFIYMNLSLKGHSTTFFIKPLDEQNPKLKFFILTTFRTPLGGRKSKKEL